ncbi:MAG: DUF2723 domain-containing protein [Armatimonadetes bacterium]|nr:DUF2723 domain-containing protein [Armatimonadota bacterium]
MAGEVEDSQQSKTVVARKAWLAGISVFLGSFALYAFTVAPTVTYGGDCGELIAASYTLGVAHPTGYPLYVLLGKLFAMIFPFGEVAFRYNLLSVLCASAATGVVALTVVSMTGSVIGGVFGGLMLSASYLFWSQAIIAEVYALNALLLSVVLYLLQRWRQEEEVRFLYVAAACLGLGLTNHSSTAFVVLAVCLYLVHSFVRRDTSLKASNLTLLAAFLAVPLLLYLYLPVRAAQHPPLNWGNPSSLHGFMNHITGRLYKSHVFGLPPGELPERIAGLITIMGLQFLLGNLLSIYGFSRMLRDRQPLGRLTALLSVLLLVVYVPYDVGDVWVFFVPLFVLWCVWMGVGAAAVEKRFFKTDTAAGVGAVLSYRFLLVFLVLFQAYVTYPRADMRGHRQARQDALAVLRSTGGQGTVLTGTDELLFSLWYLQHVERRGSRLRTIAMPEFEQKWRAGKLQPVLDEAQKQGPAYLSFWLPALQQDYTCRPMNLVVEVTEAKSAADHEVIPGTAPPGSCDFGPPRRLPPTKRGNLLSVSMAWTPRTHRVRLALAGDKERGPSRFRLWAQSDEVKEMPAESAIRQAERSQSQGWVDRWTTTFLLDEATEAGTHSKKSGLVTRQPVPVWIPPNVLCLRYRLWGRIETLPPGSQWNSPPSSVGGWRPIAELPVTDK